MVVFFFASAGPVFGYERVLRVKDGTVISFGQMINEIKESAIVFVGEIHDSEAHHKAELDVIRALNTSGVPLAIGLEMFRKDSQHELDSWVNGRMTLDKFMPVYYDNWRMPWPLYRNIFTYARDNRIPMVGLNIPDAISEKVSHKGFSSLSAEQKKDLPPNVSCDVDATYMSFIRRAYSGHAKDDQSFLHFCEAQMVWDKAMAWHLVEYLKKHHDKTAVVLAGAGHAWKRGIPEQVSKLSSYTYKVVLPLTAEDVDSNAVTFQDADYVLLM